MLIGDVARRSGVSAKTIRYYEDIGLLPAPQRSASGYRHYDDAVLERLAFVRAAQAVGLTLGEVRSIVALRDGGETPCGHVLDLLRARSAELDRRIAELRSLRGELRRLVERAVGLDPADCNPGRVCHLIGPG
jgi:DNA-binding transcriptional MerR regulator